MGFLNTVLEGLATVGQNSYTQEEKELITKTRDLMRIHGRTNAANALDEVINDFYKGVTRTSSSTTSSTTSTSGSIMSTAEFVYELKNRLKSKYGSLDTVIHHNENTIVVELKFYSLSYVARFNIVNCAYQGKELGRTSYLYSNEIAACESDVVKACREIRSL
jgi:hypothetical protein